jgi:bifunctional non-homologous end joining protein LigD
MAAKPRRAAGSFTVATPEPLPAVRHGDHWMLSIDGREVRLSNLDKIFWPERGYTKGDLLAYYYNARDRILPHVVGRPLVLKRVPDGIHGAHFLEKEGPTYTPDWMPRCAVSYRAAREGPVVNHLMVTDTASLLFVANLGAVDFHPLIARCDDPHLPDYVLFDLDPAEGARFDDVRAVALHVRAAVERLGLPSLVKTSGATGIQVHIPIARGPTFEQTRALSRTIARLIRRADPDRVTLEPSAAKRAGKVYIDVIMNRDAQNVVAAYSVRPVEAASISTPVTWAEVESNIEPGDFTLATIHTRLKRLRDDPFDAEPADIQPALDALGV